MLKVAGLYFPAMGFEGEGMALVISFQGCKNSCEGCHNPGLQSFGGGIQYSPLELQQAIWDYVNNSWIDSYVLTGGEPLHQNRRDFIKFLRQLYSYKKPIWLYTSYLFEDVPEDIKFFLNVIVDGPFVQSLAKKKLKYRGSTNQKVWHRIGDDWMENTEVDNDI